MRMRGHFLGGAAMVVLAAVGVSSAWADEAADREVLAQRMAQAMVKGDAKGVAGCLDMSLFADRVGSGFAGDLATRAKAFVMKMDLAGALAADMAGNKYDLVRIREENGKVVAIFRSRYKSEELGYTAWEIARSPDGQLRFVDVYELWVGEWLSQNLIREMQAGVDAAKQGHGGRNEFEAVTRFCAALRQKQWADVLSASGSLPASMAKDRVVLAGRLVAANNLISQGKEEYGEQFLAAFQEFTAAFPKDPALYIICMSAFRAARQYDELHTSIDRLNAFLGGDPYLDVMHGMMYIEESSPESMKKAKAAFQKAIDGAPSMPEGYWGMVTLSLQEGDFATTVTELNLIESKLNIKIGDLTKLESYEAFVRSDEYKKWMAGRKEKGK